MHKSSSKPSHVMLIAPELIALPSLFQTEGTCLAQRDGRGRGQDLHLQCYPETPSFCRDMLRALHTQADLTATMLDATMLLSIRCSNVVPHIGHCAAGPLERTALQCQARELSCLAECMKPSARNCKPGVLTARLCCKCNGS